MLDVFSSTDERSKDHVDPVLDAKLQVGNIFLGQRRKVDIGAGQVDTLPGGDLPVIEGSHSEGLLIDDFGHFEGLDAVVNVDQLPDIDHLGDVLVVDVAEE